MKTLLLAATAWAGIGGAFASSCTEVEDPESQMDPRDAPPEDEPLGRAQHAFTGIPDLTEITDGCEVGKPTQSLEDYSDECTVAMNGVDVPEFDCEDGTEVDEGNATGDADNYPLVECDRPNLLSRQCDPESKFQVLPSPDPNVVMVAHCRKKGLDDKEYGDVAVIQYNKVTGATCFYQALGILSNEAPAPSSGDTSYWFTPALTAGTNCVACHDTGPFIRTPYLARMDTYESTNVVPGAGDYVQGWNKTMPYKFVGADFQTWKAFSVHVDDPGNNCTDCHRLGTSSKNGAMNTDGMDNLIGTARYLAPYAANETQPFRNPSEGPWMPVPKPVQDVMMYPPTGYDSAYKNNASAYRACANQWIEYITDPVSKPAPPAYCTIQKYAVGDTCKQGITGSTPETDPSGDPEHNETPTGFCGGGGDCPMGIPYFSAISGPFWTDSGPGTLYPSGGWVGGMMRFETDADGYYYLARDKTAGRFARLPRAEWGGLLARDLAAVPDPDNDCSHSYGDVQSADGSHTMQTAVLGPKATTLPTLSGLVGNVAQLNIGGTITAPDWLRIYDSGSNVRVGQQHQLGSGFLAPGPLRGETRRMACSGGWSPVFLVKDVKVTTNDALVLSSPSSKHARCYISGVEGAWSSDRSGGWVVPYAHIYTKTNGNVHMLLGPTSGSDKVAAYVSCVQLL